MQSGVYLDYYYHHYEDDQMAFCRLGWDGSEKRSKTITYWCSPINSKQFGPNFALFKIKNCKKISRLFTRNKVFEGFVKSNSRWQNNVGVAKVSRWHSSEVTHLPPASFDPHCNA